MVEPILWQKVVEAYDGRRMTVRVERSDAWKLPGLLGEAVLMRTGWCICLDMETTKSTR